jgi:hypothetical protein
VRELLGWIAALATRHRWLLRGIEVSACSFPVPLACEHLLPLMLLAGP